MKKFFLVACIPLALAACGKKGPLVPPEAFVPAPIDSLKVEQKEDRFFVSWMPPTVEGSGKPLNDLAGFKIYRREVLPPSEDCEECPTAYHLMKDVDLEYLQGVRVYNNIYIFPDSDLVNGKTYQYKVISYKKDRSESDASNRARRKKVAAPSAPRLRASSGPTGVIVEWEPGPARDVSPSAGFNLYRRRGGEIGTLTLLTPLPTKERRYEDLRLERGAKYIYTVREVVLADGEYLEGALSNEVEAGLTAPD